ncbi:MAG TPA: universal stress protein [Rubrivivax sp.]|nr:universal stress protein [Rubrivivax sp.]
MAVDGSASSERAIRYLIAMLEGARRDGEGPKLSVINVQRPVSGDVSRFVASDSLKDYHHENAEKALAPARALLDAAGLKYEELQRVGEPPTQIAEAAQAQGSDLIVMGTRGLGTHTAGLIGSVAQGTVAAAAVPVLLVK